MEEFSPIETDKKSPQIKSQAAIRCARAALLLSALKISRNSSPSSPQFDRLKSGEAEEELKRELVKARKKNKTMRLCSRLEFFVQVAIVFSLCMLCLLITLVFLI